MTIKDVAQEAGVSVSTVSKIINNKADNISPATIDRVLEIAKKNHYVPYSKIKSALNSKGFTLAVMLRNVSASSTLLKGIIAGAKDRRYSVLVFDSALSQSQEASNFQNLTRHHVDGLLWEPVIYHTDAVEQQLQEQHICYQIFNGAIPDWYHDQFCQLGQIMTQQLVDLSHRTIAFVTQPSSTFSAPLCMGYEQCLYQNRIPHDPNLILPPDSSFPELVASGVSAFACVTPQSAQHVINVLSAVGYTVPNDVSVIALADDVPTPSQRISQQAVPFETYGRTLVEDLIAQCEDQKAVPKPERPALSLNSSVTLDRAFHARKKHVIVLGNINADITLNVTSLPQIGSSVVSHNMSVNLGGKGANQAMGVAKLGWTACLIAKVGNDADATMALQELNGGGVNTSGIRRDLAHTTGKAYIHVQEDGESMLTLVPGANQAVTPEYIRSMAPLFQNAGYCLLNPGPPTDCVLQAAKLSKKYQAKTIFKPSAREKISAELYQLIDILVPNRHAAAALAPFSSVEEQAVYFLQQGVKNVIITLGHRGCYLRNAEQAIWYDAPPVSVVDTTGAADAFISALAVYLLDGHELPDAVEIASHAAGFCVTKQGVIPALVDHDSLEQYLGTHHKQLRCSPSLTL